MRDQAKTQTAYDAVETAARTSYGRLVAYLASRTGDVAGAEDALSDALLAALTNWPQSGIPDRPEAWLLTAARRKVVDTARRRQVTQKAAPALYHTMEQTQREMEAAERRAATEAQFPDERLKMLFVCAHPAIDPGIRTPLMLQTVLGLEASAIASAFLVAPSTMAQRLVRAKSKIRDARIRLDVPDNAELLPRLESVLESIYAAYGTGWEDVLGADERRKGLTEEAIWLGRVAVQTLPEQPEALGLLALMLYCESRRHARRDASGCFVPLSEQDATLWVQDWVGEAESLLERAARLGRPGRFQLEAAIQSAHAQRAFFGESNWAAIVALYEHLTRYSQTVGVFVNLAAARAEAFGVQSGIAVLDALPSESVAMYQPYWALRAHLLLAAGADRSDIQDSFTRAIGLCTDPAARAYLLQRAAAIP